MRNCIENTLPKALKQNKGSINEHLVHIYMLMVFCHLISPFFWVLWAFGIIFWSEVFSIVLANKSSKLDLNFFWLPGWYFGFLISRTWKWSFLEMDWLPSLSCLFYLGPRVPFIKIGDELATRKQKKQTVTFLPYAAMSLLSTHIVFIRWVI